MKISVLPAVANAWLLSTQPLAQNQDLVLSSMPDGSDHGGTFKLEVMISATELEKHDDKGLPLLRTIKNFLQN